MMNIYDRLRASSTGELVVGTVSIAIVLLILRALLQVNSGYGVEDFLGWTHPETVRAMVDLWNRAGVPFAPWAYLAIDTFLFVPLYAVLLLRLGRLAEPPERVRWVTRIYLAVVVVLVVVDLVENLGGFLRLVAPGETVLKWSAWAHQGKTLAMGAALLLLATGALLWFAGAGLSREDKQHRARFRSAVGDMVVRSRYVLLALVLLGGLLLVMDQSRDVVHAMAAFPFQASQRGWWTLWGGTLAALALSALAVWILMFCCWFWTRSACQVRSPAVPEATAAEPRDHEELFAQLWARVLGAVPLLMVVALLGQVVHDSAVAVGADPDAAVSRAWRPVIVLLAFGLLVIGEGIVFLAGRASAAAFARAPCSNDYYNALSLKGWCLATGILPGQRAEMTGRYWLFGRIDHFWFPLLTLAGLALCRLGDAWPARTDGSFFPAFAFPVILLSVSLWLGFLGWVSLLEVRRAVPWMLFVALVVVVLSHGAGFENQLVWGAVAPGPVPPNALVRLWWCTAGLLAGVGLAYALAVQLVRRHFAGGAPLRRLHWGGWAAGGLAAGLLALGLLWTADRFGTARPTDFASTRTVPSRPSLDQALAQWLRSLCGAAPGAQGCGRTVPAEGLEVYFVSTEGGGIRAATWTAFALSALQRSVPAPATAPAEAPPLDFVARTFSISGVSGGSVGAAAFRACLRDPSRPVDACLDQWAAADELSPMLGAWMFEDVLARVLPTAFCRNPGCGFLSRAAWFEQTLESALPGLRQGLAASARGKDGRHLPHLFLNATWVETGERAIASDVEIRPRSFGGAGDQLRIARADLPLSTAAHNSARFPYVNAIGALRGRPGDCPAAANGTPDADGFCGHLADGGYFDNSGAQTTLDVLAAFGRCLTVQDGDADEAAFQACKDLPPEQRKWLREHLVPRVLMIRSGVAVRRDASAAQAQLCPDAHAADPQPGQVRPSPASRCTDSAWNRQYDEAQPVCRSSFDWLVQLTGPPVTVLHVSGLQSGRHLAESRQADAVAALRAGLPLARGSTTPPVTTVDLVANGIRFPLGWHLSRTARDGMREQAKSCTLGPPTGTGSRP